VSCEDRDAVVRSLGGFHQLPREIREELAQEAILRTLQAPNVQSPIRFAVRVARRLAIDTLRHSRSVRQWADRQVTPDTGETEEQMCEQVDHSRIDLQRLLAEAPPHHREALSQLDDRVVDLGRDPVERDRLYKRRRRALAWARAAALGQLADSPGGAQ
jgi:hypothetical protein